MSAWVPQGPPSDVDAATHRSIARTFYVYRLVRLAVQAVVLIALAVGTELGGAPWWVPVLAVVALALTVLRLWQTRKRWRRAQPAFEA